MAVSSASGRYRRVTAALDERARQRLWGGCKAREDQLASASPELADLVDSFYGGGDREEEKGKGEEGERVAAAVEREVLMGLFGSRDKEEGRVLEEVEAAVRLAGMGVGEEEVRRKVVWWLRRRGFDAGLCRSKPDGKSTLNSSTQFPARSRHPYVDVVSAAKVRYIVEINLAAEFEIARPSPEYAALLSTFPAVFVGRAEKLRDVVRILCVAAATSMRSRGMHVPPWRRREYVQGKWLGAYERSTTGEVAGGGGGEVGEEVVVWRRRRVVVACREGWECGGDGEGLQRAVVGGKIW